MTWVGTMDLPNPGSGLDALRLANGHWLLNYNDTVKGRHQLTVSPSDDEGQTWKWTRHLENQPGGQFHYAAIIQGRDGMLHAVYSYFVEGGKSMNTQRSTKRGSWPTIPNGDASGKFSAPHLVRFGVLQSLSWRSTSLEGLVLRQ